MKISSDHVLTTHTGSLPRPQQLIDLVYRKQEGKTVDGAAFNSMVGKTVDELVRRQVDIGVDVVSTARSANPASSTISPNGLPVLPASERRGRSVTWTTCPNWSWSNMAAPPASTF